MKQNKIYPFFLFSAFIYNLFFFTAILNYQALFPASLFYSEAVHFLNLLFLLGLSAEILYLILDKKYQILISRKITILLFVAAMALQDLIGYAFSIPFNSLLKSGLRAEIASLLLLAYLLLLKKRGAFNP